MKLSALVTPLLLQLTAFLLVAAKTNLKNKFTRDKLVETNDILHANFEDSPLSSGKSYDELHKNQLSPIILMPGDGGSRLQARLNRQNVLHHYCERKSNDWFDLWLNLSLLVPFALECWVDK